MTIEQFGNGLRVLYSIDSHEIGDPYWYKQFAADPFRFFMRCDDERASLIWAAMEKRIRI